MTQTITESMRTVSQDVIFANSETPSQQRFLEEYNRNLSRQQTEALPGTEPFDISRDYVAEISQQMKASGRSFAQEEEQILEQVDPFTVPYIPEFYSLRFLPEQDRLAPRILPAHSAYFQERRAIFLAPADDVLNFDANLYSRVSFLTGIV